MSSKKKIVINPEYLAGSGSILKKKKKNKTQKKNIVSSKFSNAKQRQTKKQLIDRIKKHKKMQDLINTSKKMKNDEEFQNNYEEAVSFLKNKLKKLRSKKGGAGADPQINMIESQLNNTQPNIPIMSGGMDDNIGSITTPVQQPAIVMTQPQMPVIKTPVIQQGSAIQQQLPNLVQNIVPTTPLPKYGILKGGKLPLYSQYRRNKTMKNTGSLFAGEDNNPRRQRLKEFKEDYQNGAFDNPIQNLNADIADVERRRLRKRRKHRRTLKQPKENQMLRKVKTYKRRLKLGKKGGVVSVLVKNNKTRKKIKNEHSTLKAKPIEDIKRYLRRHNLIKIGSTAPEEILRAMFETSYLSGDIYNKNSDILLHNFMLDEETL
tara:strand:- start:50 stop:1177 length:1128 start_codon:yes stop_codon:yes gene_type:complete